MEAKSTYFSYEQCTQFSYISSLFFVHCQEESRTFKSGYCATWFIRVHPSRNAQRSLSLSRWKSHMHTLIYTHSSLHLKDPRPLKSLSHIQKMVVLCTVRWIQKINHAMMITRGGGNATKKAISQIHNRPAINMIRYWTFRVPNTNCENSHRYFSSQSTWIFNIGCSNVSTLFVLCSTTVSLY